jgi:hypothetical protein
VEEVTPKPEAEPNFDDLLNSPNIPIAELPVVSVPVDDKTVKPND